MNARLVLVLVASLVGATTAKAEPVAEASRPNIVVILVDDMGFSDIGCYGSEIPTPHLDRLASNGLRFTQFYNTGRCCPTRATLLTGVYAHQAGVGHMTGDYKIDSYRGFLGPNVVSIGDVAHSAGYLSALAGKWHVGSSSREMWPRARGFDRFYGIPEGGGAHNAPHFPLQANAGDIAQFRGKYLEGWDKLSEDRYRRQVEMGLIDQSWAKSARPDKIAAWNSLDDAEKDRFDHLMAAYAACVWRMDQAVGHLVEGLDQRGVLDDTLILFMSDNGGCAESGPRGRSTGDPTTAKSNWYCGESWAWMQDTPFRKYKHYNHEGGIATPLIAHWPNGIQDKGAYRQQPAHLIDIMATIADLSGATYPAQHSGQSILPMEGTSLVPLLGDGEIERGDLFWEHEGNAAVREGDWKLVRLGGKGEWELYDLAKDRTELDDLSHKQPTVVKRLADKWMAWAARCGVSPRGLPSRPSKKSSKPASNNRAKKNAAGKKNESKKQKTESQQTSVSRSSFLSASVKGYSLNESSDPATSVPNSRGLESTVSEARASGAIDRQTAIRVAPRSGKSLPELRTVRAPLRADAVPVPTNALALHLPEVERQSARDQAAQSSRKLKFRDPDPQHYRLRARASKIDTRAKAHPEIGFIFEDAKGNPADFENASVDTRVAPRGKLVIWMMSHNSRLFDRINSYGIHAIQVHYANRWFSTCCRENPVGENCRGNIRLEAATGEDFSDEVDIPQPDGMMERALQFVRWLAKENPQGGWEYFLAEDGKGLRWEDVIMAGSSHGSTTSARFAKHQTVSRVVMFCGPRDQYQVWQKLPSATPANRYFGFSHVLDGGWVGDHYCRSWELIGLHKFGPIVNVDQTKTPFLNSRRLITDFDVGGDAGRAHSSVVPGSRARTDPDSGEFLHEDVWKYLFTHPVDVTGDPVDPDSDCLKDQRSQLSPGKR